MEKRELQRELGMNLQKIRMQQGLTREQLADQAGISPTFLANLECGNKMMSVVTLRRLADVLCVSVDALLYGGQSANQRGNIGMLLRDQPDEMVAFIEDLIRLTLSRVPVSVSQSIEAADPDGEIPADVGS